jgi:hypothetical protein
VVVGGVKARYFGSMFWKSAIHWPPAFGQPCVVVGMYV